MNKFSQKVIQMSSRYGVKNTNKQFRMFGEEKPKLKSQAMIIFLDNKGNRLQRETSDGLLVDRKRLCTYPAGNINGLVEKLKKVYNEVRFLDPQGDVQQITVKLEVGQDLDDSFFKVGL